MNKDIFNFIYKTNFWSDRSGPGSDPKNAKPWIETVNLFLENKSIESVLDLCCGDWRIGKELNLDNKNYTGVDVSSMIVKEIFVNSKNNIKFITDDIETMTFPKVNLIIIKDVLQHLPNSSVQIIMSKIIDSCNYALICNDIGENENIDILAGEHRNLDLSKDPFDYKVRLLTVFDSGYHKKSIVLYQKNDHE
jgi:SAM-dependent methyltransferase